MKPTLLITGANSFIARHLIPMLEKNYMLKLLTRTPKAKNEYKWDLENWTLDEAALDNVDYIVHLSGAKLNDGSALTEARKKLVYDSRIGAADFLREKLQSRGQQLKAFISASAIGYYGFNDSNLKIDEDGQKGFGFIADLCDDWEKAADKYKIDNIAEYVSKIRVSLVLGNDGGIFPLYADSVKTHPQIAEQVNSAAYPWNHVEDMAGIFAFAVENNLDGVYNSVAPQPASLQDVYKAIANNIADADYTIQPFAGQHLVANKIIEAGYTFKYPNIEQAVSHIISTGK